MPKPGLKEPFCSLESEIIETFLAGHHEWRPDLAYPESHSDMSGGVRALLRMFDIKRRPIALKLNELLEKAFDGYARQASQPSVVLTGDTTKWEAKSLSQPSHASGEQPYHPESVVNTAWELVEPKAGRQIEALGALYEIAHQAYQAGIQRGQRAMAEKAAQAVEGVWVSDNGTKVKQRCVEAVRSLAEAEPLSMAEKVAQRPTLTQEMLRASYDEALQADHRQHPSLFQYMADYLNRSLAEKRQEEPLT